MKVYRGAARAARAYVEADRSRVDDYYLAEGSGLAARFAATPGSGVEALGMLDGDGYEAWVAGLDPDTGVARGRLRQDAAAVRFVEAVVNGPKTWSLAAALEPEIAVALDAAQDAAAVQIIGWLAEHATTRMGPRGGVVQVPVERIEAVTVRHYTSRAGDPHRHLHLQINARVFAAGKWRGLFTIGVRDSIDAINGIGHAAVMTDPGFRKALAEHGYTLDPETGEVLQLQGLAGQFSSRARQISANVDRYEAAWRTDHPGQEPGPALLQSWDRRAWKEARPDKVIPRAGTDVNCEWVAEIYRLGHHDPNGPAPLPGVMIGSLDRDAAVETILSRLAKRRSAWNAADIRGQVEQLIARTDLVIDASIRRELAEDLTARILEACVPLLPHDAPEHIRAWTSPGVLAVEADITGRLAARAAHSGEPLVFAGGRLDDGQRDAVAALAGTTPLVVVEGAAGAGKTSALAATKTLLEQHGHRLVVVTPTLKAAQVATHEVGAPAVSAAWLAQRHGYTWDTNGKWTRDTTAADSAVPVLHPGDLLLVDEAGMLDQDTARALLEIADQTGARIAFVGDRYQLPAVGRGGVLDLATRWANPDTVVTLDRVHRFADPTYADLSLAMRTGTDPGAVFDQLATRGQIILHPTEQNRSTALAIQATAEATHVGADGRALVVADTRDQVADLNNIIRTHRVADGAVDDTHVVITATGERIGAGDRIATRRNDYQARVANRDTWTVTQVEPDGRLHLTNASGTESRTLASEYVARYVELAYATTVYGAQGDTVPVAHVAVSDTTGAASAYVAMTRGRHQNTAHLIADDLEDARRQWIAVFSRDRADLGPAHAARLAAEEAANYATPATSGSFVPRHLRRPLAQQIPSAVAAAGGRTDAPTPAAPVPPPAGAPVPSPVPARAPERTGPRTPEPGQRTPNRPGLGL